MICRIWRGWATRANADEYESIVRGQVIPGIEAMRIPGFQHIDLMRRELETEVEFRLRHVRCLLVSTSAPLTTRSSRGDHSPTAT